MKQLILLPIFLFVLATAISGLDEQRMSFKEGKAFGALNYGGNQQFFIDNKLYTLFPLKVNESSIKLRITPGYIDFVVNVGEAEEIDVNNDGVLDFGVKLNKIITKNNRQIGGDFAFAILREVIIDGGSTAPDDSCELTCREVYLDNLVYEDENGNIFVNDIFTNNEYKNWDEICEYSGVDKDGYSIYNKDKCYERVVIDESCKLTCREVYEDHYEDIFLDEHLNWDVVCEYEGPDDEGRWIYARDKCYEFQEEIEEIPKAGGGELTCDSYDKESQCWDSILGDCSWVDSNCVEEEIIAVEEVDVGEPTDTTPIDVLPLEEPEESNTRLIIVVIALVVIVGIIAIVIYQKKKQNNDKAKEDK